jgi:hypothetical protein
VTQERTTGYPLGTTRMLAIPHRGHPQRRQSPACSARTSRIATIRWEVKVISQSSSIKGWMVPSCMCSPREHIPCFGSSSTPPGPYSPEQSRKVLRRWRELTSTALELRKAQCRHNDLSPVGKPRSSRMSGCTTRSEGWSFSGSLYLHLPPSNRQRADRRPTRPWQEGASVSPSHLTFDPASFETKCALSLEGDDLRQCRKERRARQPPRARGPKRSAAARMMMSTHAPTDNAVLSTMRW